MQVTKAKQKLQSSDSHWFLFLLLPFFASITAVRNYKAPWAKNVVWAFVIFYGYTFAIAKENSDTDIVRYIEELKDLYSKSLSFYDMIDIFRDSGEADVLRTIVAIIVSRFTDNPQVLTAVYGLIFGFFFTRCMWYVLERLKGKLKWGAVLMLVVFALIDPFWNLNGSGLIQQHLYFYMALCLIFLKIKKQAL